MRSLLFSVSITFMAFFLSGCNEYMNHAASQTESNTISLANLTEREEAILLSTAEQSFVFDFNTDEQFQEVHVWVEKYEEGKLTGEVSSFSSQIHHTGSIIFTASKRTDENNQSLFTTAIHSDGTTASGRNQETMPNADSGIIWGANSTDSIEIGDQQVLGSIAFTDDGNTSSLSTGFYTDIDNRLDELKKYDLVYLIRSEFK